MAATNHPSPSPPPTKAPTPAPTCVPLPPADASPGLLNLSLTANFKGHPSYFERKQAKCKLEQLKDYLEDSASRPHRFAIQNFIALLSYQLGEEEEATDVLESLLEEDELNTNALQDLAIIYDKYHRKDDSQKCLTRLKKELEKIGNGGRSDESCIGYARILAGKALAWGFDLHPDTKGTHRLDNSIALYQKALDKAGGLVGVEEKLDWLYYLALDYTRLNNIKKAREEDQYKNTFEKAVQCLVPNHKSSDVLRVSGSWCLLGNLFSQRPSNFASTMPPIIKKFSLERHWKNPELCYLQAIEFNEKNVIARNKLAQLYYSDQKEEQALNQLNVSLKLNSWPSNHDAFRCRARICRLKYNRQYKQTNKPDQNLLIQAEEDLNKCIECDPYALDMIHLAEVHHKLSWKGDGTYDFKKQHKALHWCTKAEMYQDGAERPDLHQRRALILQDMGDHDNALKCFMQAMDFENKGTTYNRNFVYMYSSMLKRFHETEDKPKHLLQQLVYWFKEGMVKYEKTNIKVSNFVKKFPQEMLQVIEVLSISKDEVQLKLGQKCLKAFTDTKVQCDTNKLRDLKRETSLAIEECQRLTLQTPPAAKSVAKAKLTLDTSPSNFELDTSICSQGKSSIDQTGQPASREESKHSQETKEPDCLITSTSDSSTKTSSATSSTNETADLCIQDKEGGTEVASPSHLALVSPDKTPLSRFLNTPDKEAGGVEGRGVKESCKTPKDQSHPSEAQSPDKPPSTSQSKSPLSQGTTPSTPGSVQIDINIETPESATKNVKGGFCMKKEDASYLNVWEEFKRILDDTDLQLEDIGEAPETSQHTNLKYDFYVVYDHECKKIRDFVYYHLLAQLEEGKIRLKGCIQERDFIVGKEITANMDEAIRDSAKVIILVSSGFFNNGWCKQAQMFAFHPDNCDKVFPIQLEDVVLPQQYRCIHCIDARKTINWSVIRKQLEPPGLPTP